MNVRRIRYLMMGVALAASAVYLFLYLYRWEWHRAVVAGVLFLGAEVALATSLVLDRMRAVEQRINSFVEAQQAAKADAVADIRARLHESAPAHTVSFEWLRPDPDRLSVFVPILLGAGVILSGVAWCVERLSRATAGSVLEIGLARQLAPFAIPVGTLEQGWTAGPLPTRRPALPKLIAVALVAVLAVGTLKVVADATQNRPDARIPGSASIVTLSVTNLRPGVSAERTAANLLATCSSQLGARHETGPVILNASGLLEVRVTPSIGKYTERRFRGCIGDTTTDLVRGRVHSITALSE